MSAKRPYRDAMPWERVVEIMSKDVGSGIDAECFEAVRRWHDRSALASRVEQQLQEVERLISEL
jgi:HD-GYP domain-containing protein (c-di-GMP phosphodiesterase class II)